MSPPISHSCRTDLDRCSKKKIMLYKRFPTVREAGSRVCLVLPSLHALTGCDALSSFAGKGMKRAFEMVRCESQFMSESVGVL